MSQIAAVGIAEAPYIFPQDLTREFAREFFKKSFQDIERLLTVFTSTNINKRHFVVPLEWFKEEHSFTEKNKIYQEYAIKLGSEAILQALSNTGYSPKDINHIFFVSSTGLSTPSIDAYIVNELGMSTMLKRTPIWGLGCAGGAMGLAKACEYVKYKPQDIAVVVAVELCGLTFLREDKSKSNLIATSLFGDGAAAALIIGDEVEKGKNKVMPQVPKFIDSTSIIWPDTLDVMGWDIQEGGFKVIFSKDIPTIVGKYLAPQFDEFLKSHNLGSEDIEFFIAHPGGTKVLEAYHEFLNIPAEYLADAKKVLTDYGNMSSPTVLYVLAEAMKNHQPKGGYGILTALGPGFSSELMLLQW